MFFFSDIFQLIDTDIVRFFDTDIDNDTDIDCLFDTDTEIVCLFDTDIDNDIEIVVKYLCQNETPRKILLRRNKTPRQMPHTPWTLRPYMGREILLSLAMKYDLILVKNNILSQISLSEWKTAPGARDTLESPPL